MLQTEENLSWTVVASSLVNGHVRRKIQIGVKTRIKSLLILHSCYTLIEAELSQTY